MRSDRAIVLFLLALCCLAGVAQFVIDFSFDNVAATCLVWASSFAVLLYILWTDAIRTHPLSTFAIFGFCVTSQLGALLAQSGSGVALALNLRQPLETFAWLAVYQLVALVAHSLYRLFSHPPAPQHSSIVRTLLERLGLYRVPTVGSLWFLGPMGLCGHLLASVNQGAIGKIGQSLAFLAWAPFLIPVFLAELGPGYCDRRRHYPMLALYVALIALMGLAANARGMMLSGLMTIALCLVLRAMRSSQPVRAVHVGRLVLLALVVGAMAIPVSDLMVAMAMARKSRGNVSPVKMVEDTLYYVTQPDQLRAQRARDSLAAHNNSYDETYFDNPLLGRLMETKFHDNALYFGSHLNGRDEERLWDLTGDFLWATLPDPMLKALKIDVDKQSLGFSMGDYLSYLGGAGELGGFKTGSAFGQGLAMFGVFFPLVYLLICPVLFLTVDVLSYRNAQGSVLVSSLGLLGIWRMFQYGITAESLQAMFMGVARGLPQNIALFLLLCAVARVCDGVLQNLLGAGRQQHAAGTHALS